VLLNKEADSSIANSHLYIQLHSTEF